MTGVRVTVQVLPDLLREVHLLKINKKWYPQGSKLFRSWIFKGPLRKREEKSVLQLCC